MDNRILVLLPIVAFAVNVSVHILVFRFRLVKSMLKAIVAGFAVGLLFLWIALAGLAWTAPGEASYVVYFTLGTLTYGLLGYNYFHFTNLGETARRIRILREFVEHGSMSAKELLTHYNSAEIIRVRLGRLVRSSQIEIAQSGAMRIKDRSVLRMANMMVMLKCILLAKKE